MVVARRATRRYVVPVTHRVANPTERDPNVIKRLAVSAAALFMFAILPGVAEAQTTDYPPGTAPTSTVDDAPPPTVEDGAFVPGATLDIGVSSTAIVAGRTYTGTLESHPIALPNTVALQDGFVLFRDVPIPSDFELGAYHKITLVDAATGAVVAISDFYVGSDGRVFATAPAAGGGSASPVAPGGGATTGQLPRTGSGAGAPVKAGLGLIAVGGLAVLSVRTRRTRDAVTA